MAAPKDPKTPPKDLTDDVSVDGDAETGDADTNDEFYEDEAAEDIAEEIEAVTEDADASQPEAEPISTEDIATADIQTTPAPVTVQRVGFVPLVLGGVVAALLGAAALYYANTQGWVALGGGNTDELTQQIAAQNAEIAKLQQALNALTSAEGPDLAPLEGAVRELSQADAMTATKLDALSALVTDTSTRLGELEVQPIPKAELPQEVVAAYEAQLAEALASIDGRFEALQTVQNEALAKATATEEAAAAAAAMSAARTAASQIEMALDSGAGFAEPLAKIAEVTGNATPGALAAVAETGTPALDALQDSFPDLARAALQETARSAAGSGEVSSFTAFLQTQLGARSLAPREGDDPDAVLSRAEAAMRVGDIDTTLTEIDALPEAGKTLFTDWIAQATALRDAKAAAADLVASLNAQ